MTFGVRRKIERYYENMQRDEVEEKLKGKPLVEEDIVGFCEKRLGFKPTSYQEKLFRDQNQFIVGIWSRQSGKSQALAVLALYQALAKPKARIVVLAPSLRQSRKIVQRVGSFLTQLPDHIVSGKILQTRLKFVNGSSIEALPNNAPTARGETLDMLIVDESGWIQNDKELYDASVYSLLTTNGRFISASTPGPRDTLFYLMCTDNETFGKFSRHHVGWRDAMEPNGPLKREALEAIREQMKNDQPRWQREMDAEFSETEDAFLPVGLINKCVDEKLEYFTEGELLEGR